MNYKTLMDKIAENNIPHSLISINDGLKPNAYILFKNYDIWEYFYLDEKGGRQGFREFRIEEDAFDFLWKKLEIEIAYPPTKPPFNL